MAAKGKHVDKSKLATRRDNAGWTQQELADAAGVPLSCVVKAERRGRRTNDAVVAKLAAALGVNENAIT